jgi:hypothetical protein
MNRVDRLTRLLLWWLYILRRIDKLSMAVFLSQLPFEVGCKDSIVSPLLFSPSRYSKVLVEFIASQAIPPDILVRLVSDFDVAGPAMIDSARRIY